MTVNNRIVATLVGIGTVATLLSGIAAHASGNGASNTHHRKAVETRGIRTNLSARRVERDAEPRSIAKGVHHDVATTGSAIHRTGRAVGHVFHGRHHS